MAGRIYVAIDLKSFFYASSECVETVPSAIHTLGGGGPGEDRQNHLPCDLAVVEGIRSARTRPPIRSQSET